MTGHLEIERKYEVNPDFTLPDLGGDAPRTQTLVARYFDTSDLRLAACGITLRQRRGGEDEGWHLKLPIDVTARRELRDTAGGDAVPGRFAELVAAYARGRPLEPVATLETRRTVVRLRGDDGGLLAEIADDRVRGETADGRGRTWREIEVELAAGSPDLLDAVEERLWAAGARPSRAPSKLARLLAIPRPAPPDPPRTAGDVVVAYVAEQVATILAYDPRVRLAEYDSVHKMRVAVRRIRSLLRSGSRQLTCTDPLEAELKWLADALGEVRDLEVLRERFARRLAGAGVPTPAWLTALGERQEAAERRLNRTLSGGRYFALLDALEGFVADPPLAASSRGTASDLVTKAWRRMTRRHAEIESGDHPDEARHRTRKAAKRARYTAEAASPVLGESAKRMAERAKKIQETLGAYQDSVIARERLAALAAEGADPITIGMLAGIERSAADQALRDADRAWRRATKTHA